MSQATDPAGPVSPAAILLQSHEERLQKLEDSSAKGPFRRLTENAGACALILGLVLSLLSLYDVVVTKPAAERIATIAQFNAAVNAAAKTRQDLVQAQLQTQDQQLRMLLGSMATPRILNDIATARALMPLLGDDDIGIPQLIVLIDGAFNTDDKESARTFITRALGKRGLSGYYLSEAKRYEGKFLFWTGALPQARDSFQAALAALGPLPLSAAARAYALADLLTLEFMMGDCAMAAQEAAQLTELLQQPTVTLDARRQIAASAWNQMRQMPPGRCPIPPEPASG